MTIRRSWCWKRCRRTLTPSPRICGRGGQSRAVWGLFALLRLGIGVREDIIAFGLGVVVLAGAAQQVVGAAATVEVVVAFAAIEQVIARAAEQHVVAGAAVEAGGVLILLRDLE